MGNVTIIDPNEVTNTDIISPRKPSTAGFWITVALVAVLVGYPLSMGPACRISSRHCGRKMPGEQIRPIGIIYWPIAKIAQEAGEPIWILMDRYACLYAKRGWSMAYSDDLDMAFFLFLGGR